MPDIKNTGDGFQRYNGHDLKLHYGNIRKSLDRI